MKRFITATLAIILVASVASAQDVVCHGGKCYRVAPIVPQRIVVPRVTYEPYQYKSSYYTVRRGPLGLFSWGRVWHSYSPVQPKAKQ